jgi:hypothetical protein
VRIQGEQQRDAKRTCLTMWYYPAFAELPRRSQASIATAEVGGMTSSLSQVQDPGVVDRLRAYEITYDRFQIELCCCYYCGGITCGNGNAVMITGDDCGASA